MVKLAGKAAAQDFRSTIDFQKSKHFLRKESLRLNGHNLDGVLGFPPETIVAPKGRGGAGRLVLTAD